ncbi:M24 family metallopeptidase [Estrella lausannensis]|uniref:Metallopeptidase n=1 Tax=Estrella lausannensis TaxID=483423 RepID=A0A0H5DQV2_9BACT|nr:M24 family metallopeptidase [Estrella lausannensis]CRX37979.1 Metallopeptidase [Estrella lausannensis]
MEKIQQAQKILREKKLDGWLLYDFRRSNTLAIKFLELQESAHLTRRLAYFIPAEGEPVKIVHAIEDFHLDHLPGRKVSYAGWQAFHERIAEVTRGKKIAMEYSPLGAIPYVSKVDAGIVELISGFGASVFSSKDLLQHFTVVMDEEAIHTMQQAGAFLEETATSAFLMIEKRLQQGESVTEASVQRFIQEAFDKKGYITDSPPICAAGKNSANPHYAGGEGEIRKGDPVLIDLWCKKDQPGSIYGDITKMGYAGMSPPARFQEVFALVREAQKAATDLVIKRVEAGETLLGYEVDDAARIVIQKKGYGPHFIHRTGHNIHTETHGDGANMDNYETHDDREVIAATAFSIEPGIYLRGEFGVRLEYDLLVHPDRRVEIIGGVQDSLFLLDV